MSTPKDSEILSKGALYYALVLINFLFIGCCYFLFAGQAGTHDMNIWIKSISAIREVGPIDGYTLSAKTGGAFDYPPLYIPLFFLFEKISKPDNWIIFELKKYFIYFHLASIATIYWIKKDILICGLFGSVTALSVVAFGYIDIFYAAPFIASVYLISTKRYFLGSILFCISMLIKWQPIINIPFILIWLYSFSTPKELWNGLKSRQSLSFFSGFLIVFFVVISLYKYHDVWNSFLASISHSKSLLSGNALNFNYQFTVLINLIDGESLHRLIDRNSFPNLWPWVQIPFYSLLIFFSIKFFLTVKDPNLASYLIYANWLYFMVNTGVHENHLFMALLLCFLLPLKHKEYIKLLLLTSLSFNLNLIAFYGTIINEYANGLLFFKVSASNAKNLIVIITTILNIYIFCVIFRSILNMRTSPFHDGEIIKLAAKKFPDHA